MALESALQAEHSAGQRQGGREVSQLFESLTAIASRTSYQHKCKGNDGSSHLVLSPAMLTAAAAEADATEESSDELASSHLYDALLPQSIVQKSHVICH